jgi:hypothetical protein
LRVRRSRSRIEASAWLRRDDQRERAAGGQDLYGVLIVVLVALRLCLVPLIIVLFLLSGMLGLR